MTDETSVALHARATDLERQAALLRREANAARGREDEAAWRKAAEIPVNRDAVQLTSGAPVPQDGSHRDIGEDGQQKGYIVLSADERAKGFVRPFRDAYRHLTCRSITTMGRSLAETYARDPAFYSGTFCVTCKAHFPVGEDGEFTWYEMDGREGPKVGT